ncbi:MAG: hypothetical protein A2821_00910 [Candidatus Magasanikbacteria bacterium RIFCSPHIGHO2_01_FULL_41_23]|uniref:Uncharacterized protein n=1 Tax=Candidatus Magasanikbacteria bacterium RIFCSPLOWO2_01_FULL_40_15 TaxID=1798686 RepID=A0A1F6N0J8_9BACT|nr:MAG: hypothetical protein A2821_00910 [Candidatus Magasanikbacteria bacterium RIFCSPHIGHO2_01_FULL_41_23]OGH74735.1 MAG: hypothetical protein A3F22_02265 [Candidatus Magasanikbacteria bacterium RIFCSPHIGHO2_12_FULL_41_16]OGH77449.1 MAG: hypothetical protein A2983_01965 [Candidatus Magasanikbacteria bacterium RIFCSPLOWO2_01_FULL_40_15]
MRVLKFYSVLFIALMIIFNPHQVSAGLGISPAKIINERLLLGSSAVSVLTLSRSDAQKTSIVHLGIDFSSGSWIISDKGREIVWEKNEHQLLIPFRIQAPVNASLGTYHGSITITEIVTEKDSRYSTQTVLGTSVPVELVVIKTAVTDFILPAVKMFSAYASVPWMRWKIPGTAELILTVQNTGNTRTGPTKVQVDVYDQNEKNFVERVEIKKVETVSPFTTKEIILTVPHNLNVGEYTAYIKVFEGYRLTEGGERRINFSVKPGSIRGHYLRLIAEIIKSNVIILAAIMVIFVGIFIWLKRRKFK